MQTQSKSVFLNLCLLLLLQPGRADNTISNQSDFKDNTYLILEWRGNIKVNGKLLVGYLKNREIPDIKIPATGSQIIPTNASIVFEKTSDFLIVRDEQKTIRTITPLRFSFAKTKTSTCTSENCHPVIGTADVAAVNYPEFYNLSVKSYINPPKIAFNADHNNTYTILQWRGNVKANGQLLVGQSKDSKTPDIKTPKTGTQLIPADAVITFEKTSDYLIVRYKTAIIYTIKPKDFSYRKESATECNGQNCEPVIAFAPTSPRPSSLDLKETADETNASQYRLIFKFNPAKKASPSVLRKKN